LASSKYVASFFLGLNPKNLIDTGDLNMLSASLYCFTSELAGLKCPFKPRKIKVEPFSPQ
jgi:hypothetical protein